MLDEHPRIAHRTDAAAADGERAAPLALVAAEAQSATEVYRRFATRRTGGRLGRFTGHVAVFHPIRQTGPSFHARGNVKRLV